MKKILGLDLGTNSIGWALVESDFKSKTGKIIGIGSRIIPMSQEILGEFEKGNSISQTAKRTQFRGARRLRERHLLRRERLHRTLNILGFLPKHYSNAIDFENRLGQFKPGEEPKLPYHNNTFIFRASFEEMLSEFKKHQPKLLADENGHNKLVPYDWTLYYLRKKALSKRIEKEELAWIILNFNQKRGYYQLRGEEEDDEKRNKLVEFQSVKVVDVKADETLNNKGERWYSIILENGWVYRRASKHPLVDWKGKVRDFIVTTELNEDGSVKTDKEGKEKRSFRSPGENDWTLIKKKTEQEIDYSKKTVGTYIFDNLLQHPKQKIRGKLIRTIERKYYKQELNLILTTQKRYHPELQDKQLYHKAIQGLYIFNDAHRLMLTKKDFVHLLVEDIIFYQRPLRSKKSLINNCSFEYRKYINDNGEQVKEYLKAIPKSNPYYQEFRVWQWMQNLKIYNLEDEEDLTLHFLPTIKEKEELFEFLMSKKEVNDKDVIRFLLKPLGLKSKALDREVKKYRWNYVYNIEKDESKKYPCNETGYEIRKRLDNVPNIPENLWSQENIQKLWHIIYSVTDKVEYEKALRTFAKRMGVDINSFTNNFINFPPFRSEYGSFSEKAIKKLLPLMRIGKYWNWDNIDSNTQARIQKLITGEFDENIKDDIRDKAIKLTKETDFQGLQLRLVSYIVFGQQSDIKKWDSITELSNHLEKFRQHSLRNPIVEQVVVETLRVVRDIWIKYGNGENNYFDEIHIELGRELKNSADQRKRMSAIISENENTNTRIKALLIELMNDGEIENVRPYSPMQQEILKIYEEGVLKSSIDIEDDILRISKKAEPSRSELIRYKLWLEQKYRSPYTGQPIPLGKLFTPAYEIEHIIPQSRFYDDSLSNKVICEAIVNKKPYKDNQLALEFIRNQGGAIVNELSHNGKIVKVFTESEYTHFVKKYYTNNPNKRNKLLLDDIPEKMIERQLNDTRYISKYISAILSNIVREGNGDEGVNSKNLISLTGKITNRLKKDWGLNDIWNDIIMPRFIRMNEISDSAAFTSYNEKHQKHLPAVPFEFSKGFQKKRIDHRHHALDALIIACTTRAHINLLNNEHAQDRSKTKDEKQTFRYDLRRALCDKKYNTESSQNYSWVFKKPWETFTQDAKNNLENTVASFKQNLRVINKATNKYESFKDKNGKIRIGKDGKQKKEYVKQKGVNWAIRKPLHKEFTYGKVDLKRLRKAKGKTVTAIRKPIDTTFDIKKIENSITDTGIKKILRNYLRSKSNNPELAFSAEGIEDMNREIEKYNDGKFHQPIYKVRIFEVGSRFSLGETGNKKEKYVEAAIGTNLFFAIYEGNNGKRHYETIPLNAVIEHQKWRASLPKEEQNAIPMVPIRKDNGEFLFYLSPNDLVYIPSEEEEATKTIDFQNLTKEQIDRIYKMVSCTGSECHFIKANIASLIKNYDAKTKLGELGSLNKLEVTLKADIRIKEKCIKLKSDRLGNISKAQ